MTMKRLDQMTMREYIDLRCGEYPEGVTEKDAALVIAEYQDICDPASVKANVHKAGNAVKEQLRLKILNIVQVLLRMGYHDDAVAVYEEYSGMAFSGDAESLSNVIKRKVMQLEFSIKRAEDLAGKEPQQELTPATIRRKYDDEVASLMAYHKMPISIDTITASVYAHLVYNTSKEIKSRLASVKKTR